MIQPPEVETFIVREQLPQSFRATIERVYAPLAAIFERVIEAKQPYLIGLSGPQGSGKSTGAAALQLLLRARGLKVALLSLDDVYLTLADRRRLAADIHPLLATRGPPGTHDLDLLNAVLTALRKGADVALPAFDKARDDRRPEPDWPVFAGPADVIILEGWCVGARPAPAQTLERPLNALERDLDPDGVWRRFVNTMLEHYQRLFQSLDFLILLQAPSFDVVADWRAEQEAKLRAAVKSPSEDLRLMSPAQIARFVQHYERVTRDLIQDGPARADALVKLNAERGILGLTIRAAGFRNVGP